MPPPRNSYSLGVSTGFTLAEVLITLGIIGIVAAMTMPSLISNHQRKTVAVKVKKSYSELYQAIKLSEARNGDMKEWNFEQNSNDIDNTTAFVEQYIKPYYTSLKICTTGGTKGQCGQSVSSSGVNYTSANGTGISILAIKNTSTLAIIIDTNGAKGPNLMGTDYFYFDATNGQVRPNGWHDGITREKILSGFDSEGYTISCKKTSHDADDASIYTLRHGCTALLMIDGWEFKDDYPW